ncbi:MAG: phosphoglycolate phosphatase [Planctomycetaceae bacterium]|jgi:phosphoglycolate phosphatase|nr:phosphoglycolate phosphatase [Planctomycetaceae bacterium]
MTRVSHPTHLPEVHAAAIARLRGHVAPEAVLFDLDGTLVDSVQDIFVAVNELLRELGLPVRTRDEVATWVGNGARTLVERAIAGRFSGFAGEPDARERHAFVDAAMPRFRAIYERVCVDHTVPLAGATAALADAQRRGLGVAIVTNKPLAPTERIVDALGWRAHVSVVIGGDSMPVRKPDPAPLFEALRRLDAQHGWMVGDSANDVGAAKAARMPSLVVRGGYNHGQPVESLDPAPDLILDSLEPLPLLLDSVLDG